LAHALLDSVVKPRRVGHASQVHLLGGNFTRTIIELSGSVMLPAPVTLLGKVGGKRIARCLSPGDRSPGLGFKTVLEAFVSHGSSDDLFLSWSFIAGWIRLWSVVDAPLEAVNIEIDFTPFLYYNRYRRGTHDGYLPWSLYRSIIRTPVSISTGFPGGIGFWGNPTPCRHVPDWFLLVERRQEVTSFPTIVWRCV